MKIKKELDIEHDNNGNIICGDLLALKMVIGTSAVSGNLHIYGVKKEEQKYIVPLKLINDRIKALENRRDKIEEYLDVMHRVVKL